jgi:hypothetical protein
MKEQDRGGRTTGGDARAEAPLSPGLATVFPPGTILSCSWCEEGLYKVMARATTADLVLDDGTLLHPLNATVPAREVWNPLTCLRCGGRLYKAGQHHTLQGGWQ